MPGMHAWACFHRKSYRTHGTQIWGTNLTKSSQHARQKAYGTRCSQAVPHPSTILARRCLTSVIGRERVCSSWYGRRRRPGEFLASLDAKFDIFQHFLRTPGYARRGMSMHAQSVQMMKNTSKSLSEVKTRALIKFQEFSTKPHFVRHKLYKPGLSGSGDSALKSTDKKYQTTYSH